MLPDAGAHNLAGAVVNNSRLKFVLTEIDLAATFLEVASATHDPVVRARQLAHARQAYDLAKDVLSIVQCDAEQRAQLQAGLSAVQDKLQASSLKLLSGGTH